MQNEVFAFLLFTLYFDLMALFHVASHLHCLVSGNTVLRSATMGAYWCFGGQQMLDTVFLVGTVAFFVLALAYVQGCEKL